MIYLDNAATSNTKPQCVIDAVVRALTDGTGNCGRGTGKAALDATRIVYNCRKRTAEFFGFPDASCVAFTSNSTEALNIAICGTAKAGDHVVTTAAEHNSVLRPLFFLEKNGIKLDIVPLDDNGNIRYDIMEQMLTPETKAVVVTQVSNVTGNRTDMAKIFSILKKYRQNGKRPLCIVDASQSAGSFEINASDADGNGGRIDILCFTGHKALMGPQGTGGLCVMPDIKIAPFKRGGSGIQSYNKDQPDVMPTKLEAGTLNAHGLTGLDAALGYLQKIGIKEIRKHEQMLTQLFYDGIKGIPGIKLYGDFRKSDNGSLIEHAPVVSLNVGETDAAQISDILSEDYGIATRAGAHCAPLVHYHFGTVRQGMVRFSFGWFTTKEDITAAVTALAEIQKDIGNPSNYQ